MKEVIRYICETCGEEYDCICADKCEKCGKEVCPGCQHFYDGQTLCDDCYDNR